MIIADSKSEKWPENTSVQLIFFICASDHGMLIMNFGDAEQSYMLSNKMVSGLPFVYILYFIVLCQATGKLIYHFMNLFLQLSISCFYFLFNIFFFTFYSVSFFLLLKSHRNNTFITTLSIDNSVKSGGFHISEKQYLLLFFDVHMLKICWHFGLFLAKTFSSPVTWIVIQITSGKTFSISVTGIVSWITSW